MVIKMTKTHLWLAIVLSGVLTFLIRFFFIQISHNTLSEKTKELLSFIPPTVLSALVFGSIFKNGLSSVTPANPYLWASIAAGIVAIKFKNVLLTIITGMTFIWIWNYM